MSMIPNLEAIIKPMGSDPDRITKYFQKKQKFESVLGVPSKLKKWNFEYFLGLAPPPLAY